MNLSPAEHGLVIYKDVMVRMRDGVRLAVNVYHPDAVGKFPALLALSPYGKEIQELPLPPQSLDKSAVWDGVIEAGDSQYIVSRGYVHVIGDLRGTGYSDGEYVGIHSKQEGEDGYDLVEWIAQQPWCDGNVGMTGISYFAMLQCRVACEQPPHLKAIFPFEVHVDHAMDGDKALLMFEREADYDLIIMDIKLPGMNGHEVTRKIREVDQNIPIIANTAYAMSGEKEKAIQAGCNLYLTKPTDRSLLISAIIEFLG